MLCNLEFVFVQGYVTTIGGDASGSLASIGATIPAVPEFQVDNPSSCQLGVAFRSNNAGDGPRSKVTIFGIGFGKNKKITRLGGRNSTCSGT